MSTKSEVIHTRVEPDLKDGVDAIFRELGLSTTEAIRMFLRQVQLRQGLPFDVKLPNAVTLETFRKTDAGEDLHVADSDDELFDQLGI